MKKNLIYAGMAADIVHYGHIKLINKAAKKGDLIIGLLSDDAIKSYKRKPVFNYKHRKYLIQNIKGVKRVVRQNSLSYTKNLKKYKPNFVIHGDDWKSGKQMQTRLEVLKCIKQWGGKLIEVKYTKGISTTKVIQRLIRE